MWKSQLFTCLIGVMDKDWDLKWFLIAILNEENQVSLQKQDK
jgi:hypothetical protein